MQVNFMITRFGLVIAMLITDLFLHLIGAVWASNDGPSRTGESFVSILFLADTLVFAVAIMGLFTDREEFEERIRKETLAKERERVAKSQP